MPTKKTRAVTNDMKTRHKLHIGNRLYVGYMKGQPKPVCS